MKTEMRKRPLRRRWFRLGPGLALAIIGSVFVWMKMPRRPVVVAAPPMPVAASQASAPDPHWLAQNAEALRLTPEQKATMQRLGVRWDRDTAELRRNLAEASEDVSRTMAGRSGKGMPLAEVQRMAAPVSELTRQLASARRSWWSEASGLLSSSQRRAAEDAWARRLEKGEVDR